MNDWPPEETLCALRDLPGVSEATYHLVDDYLTDRPLILKMATLEAMDRRDGEFQQIRRDLKTAVQIYYTQLLEVGAV